MPSLTITLYATTVVNGIVMADSTITTLTIPEISVDSLVDRFEWGAYLNSPNGHIAGSTTPPMLFDAGSTGNVMNGTLYSPVRYTQGTNLGGRDGVLRQLDKSGYQVSPTDLSICYLAGTLIAPPHGEVPVETLRTGNLVMTRDRGAQPLVWTSSTRVTREVLDQAPNQRPIRIEAGALGNGLPRRSVEVSPQHRVLVRHGGREYLISARHLMMAGVAGVSVRQDDSEFTLVHIAFAQHEIVLAEGAEMESFFTGPMAVRALGLAQRLGLCMAFPELAQGENRMTPARPFIKYRDYARMLAASSAA